MWQFGPQQNDLWDFWATLIRGKESSALDFYFISLPLPGNANETETLAASLGHELILGMEITY